MSDAQIEVINAQTEDNLTGIIIDGVPYLYWLRVYQAFGLTANHARRIIERLEEATHFISFSREEFREKYPTVYTAYTVIDYRASRVIFLTAEGYNRALLEIRTGEMDNKAIAEAIEKKRDQMANIFTRYQKGEVLSIASDEAKAELPKEVKAAEIVSEYMSIADSFNKYATPHLKQVDPGMVISVSLSQAEQKIQKLGGEVDLSYLKGMIPRGLTEDPATLNATAIGLHFSISKRLVNPILEKMGLQTKGYNEGSSGKHIVWSPTPEGELYGEWKPITKGHKNGSIHAEYRWYWRESVLPIIRSRLYGLDSGQQQLAAAAGGA